jgi:CO/xanthine dehydrogenase FAD-binding subunit
VALDASVRLTSSRGSRIVPLDQFLVGPGQTRLGRDELISEIGVPAASLGSGGCFTKLGIRNALTIAIASVAVVVDRENRCRVAYGSLAPRAVRARDLEDAVNERKTGAGDSIRPYVLRAISPITDIRASDEYRREMAVNLTYVSLHQLGLVQGCDEFARGLSLW